MAAAEGLYAAVMDALETEVMVVTGTAIPVQDQGKRGRGPALVWRPLLISSNAIYKRPPQIYSWTYIAVNAAINLVSNMQRNPHEAAATIGHWINVLENEVPGEIASCTQLADTVQRLQRHLKQVLLDIDAGAEAMHLAAQSFASDWNDEADDLFVQSTQECEQGKQATSQAWRSWCSMALTGGAGPGHRWSKANAEWIPSTTLRMDGRVIADPHGTIGC